jgi:hypothetical protein
MLLCPGYDWGDFDIGAFSRRHKEATLYVCYAPGSKMYIKDYNVKYVCNRTRPMHNWTMCMTSDNAPLSAELGRCDASLTFSPRLDIHFFKSIGLEEDRESLFSISIRLLSPLSPIDI